MVIRREIEVKRKGLPRPIDVTYGTNLLDLEFVVIDFNIPAGAVVRAFAMGESQKAKSLPCNIEGNKIWFTPEAGLFDEGKNVLQFALEHEGKNLFTFYNPINCHYTMQFEGAQDLENDPAFVGMVMRMQQDIAELKKNGSGATKEQIEQIEKNKQNISELSEQKVDKSGHTSNMYLGTDSNGNVVTVDSSLLVEEVISALSGETTEAGILSDNKFDNVFDETGKLNTATGENASASTLHRTSDYLDLGKTVEGNVYYAISESLTGSFGICVYDENKTFVDGGQHGSGFAAGIYSMNTSTKDLKPRYFRVYAPISWTGQVYVSDIRPSSFENVDYTYEYSEGGTTGGANITVNVEKPFKGQTIVNFGDSIFGKRRPPEDISTKLAELTGATVHNCGFGGCHMSNHWATTYNAFSMCNLANAIVNNEWTAQESAIADTSSNAVPSYFSEALEILKGLDFNDVDIITIAYGTNDFTNGDVLENASNLYDIESYAGALRYSIETLLTAYPHLKIFICSQTYRFWMDDSNVFTQDSDTYLNTKNVKLTDFVEKTKEIAKEYKLPFIDNYYSLGFNKFNRSHYFPATDGTHPLTTGCHLIAEHMANELF